MSDSGTARGLAFVVHTESQQRRKEMSVENLSFLHDIGPQMFLPQVIISQYNKLE